MPSLDARGVLAAVQLSVYVPIAIVTGWLVFRFSLRRDAGWLFLFIFTLCREIDGILVVAGQTANPNVDLFTPAYTLQTAGLAPLMLAPLGFIGLVGRNTFSDTRQVSRTLKFLSVMGLVALVFAIAGALLSSPVAPNHGAAGVVLSRVGACTFAVLYLSIVLLHFVALSYRWHIKESRRRLLTGLFVALPFLGVRTAYAILSAWSSSDLFGRQLSGNATLAAVNPVTGNYVYFLVLSVLCELVVVFIYLISSMPKTWRWR
ncbi:hypothetical protein JOM56_006320 [Amanita muscaria]